MAPATALGSTVFGDRDGWWPGWPLSVSVFWTAPPALLAVCAVTPFLLSIARRRERLLSWWLVGVTALAGAALAACGALAVVLPFVPLIAVDRADPGRTSADLVTTALIGYASAGAAAAVGGWLVLAAARARDRSRSKAPRRAGDAP